ncbi:2-deoxystreptamine glucosyltransferase [Pseudobythopirellula maris]|uniref:2-deoxystreptamine glucosyltransferase n=1 Tax=Pseudobythopirellula maris TaxID=2527991 RepID=A0A5C5ZRQ6_9BACT|nr:glycosyltransferase [Pseudobythopirellula maris]TWT89738.1 2-deoxystreptamine glucosyltransferase [Pseudobythopirellula maris]
MATKHVRVAYVTPTFERGGLERCIAHLVNGLDAQRYTPLIVSLTTTGAAADWIERDGLRVIELHKPPGNDIATPRRLAQLLVDERIDVVHSHNWGSMLETCLAVRWARKAGSGVRWAHAEHGLELDRFRVTGWKRAVRRRLMRWCLRRCDAPVAIADCVAMWMHKLCGVPEKRIRLVPNGVERPPTAEGREAVRRRLDIPENAFVFGSIGRLIELKGYETAIDALALLRSPSNRGDDAAGNAVGAEAWFLLVGGGEERAALESFAREQGQADRVRFVGAQSEVGPYLAAMDAYVNTSHTEAMNLSILEAFSHGLPVAASEVGDNAKLLAGPMAPGSIFPAGDAERLANLLSALAADGTTRKSLGEAAIRRYAEHYTVAGMVDRYAALYDALMEGGEAA